MNSPLWMIVLAPACSRRRNKRDQQNFAAGKFRTFCFQEIRRRLQLGAKSRRSKEPRKTRQMYKVGAIELNHSRTAQVNRAYLTSPRTTQAAIPPKPTE